MKQHGGVVVLFEKEADVKLVDHTRKNLPADTYEPLNQWLVSGSPSGRTSYQYVERSVRNGRLEDLEAHRTGPSAPRPMGASHIPKKGTRTDYSLQEDQIIYDYLYPYELEENAPISGSKIYQELAQKVRTFPAISHRHIDSSDTVSPTFMAILALQISQDSPWKASPRRRCS